MNTRIFQHNLIPEDTSFETKVPVVPNESIDKYKQYIERGYLGASEPSFKDLSIYESYVKQI